jgi:hypothetical protein
MVAAVLVAAGLSGCAGAAPSSWVYARPGASETQREQDQRACLHRCVGTADVKPLPSWGQTFNREAFNDCMRSRGYDVRLGQLRP